MTPDQLPAMPSFTAGDRARAVMARLLSEGLDKVARYGAGNAGGGALNELATFIAACYPPADVTTTPRWFVDANPVYVFGEPWAVIPEGGPPAKAGNDNKLRASLELSTDADVSDINMKDPALDPDIIVFNGYDAIVRVQDPVVPNRKCFHFRTNKEVFEWDVAQARFRSEVTVTGTDRYEPWGSDEWCVGAILLPDYWSNTAASTSNNWHVLFQWHGSGSSLATNPPLAIEWVGGGGVPAANKFLVRVRNYDNPAWPATEVEGDSLTDYDIPGAATGIWHYFLWRYVTGCGYLDEDGQEVYGKVGSEREAFVQLYYVAGEGAPVLVVDHQDFWGAPSAQSSTPTEKGQPGYWKTGIYCDPSFLLESAGDDRDLYSLGFQQTRVADLPPDSTASDVLAIFKASRIG